MRDRKRTDFTAKIADQCKEFVTHTQSDKFTGCGPAAFSKDHLGSLLHLDLVDEDPIFANYVSAYLYPE